MATLHFEDSLETDCEKGLEKTVSRSSIDTVNDLPQSSAAAHNPVTIARSHTRIPIEYRTLSIHVYDSQRFDHNAPHASEKKWFGGKKGDIPVEDDATFFGKLDFHQITPHLVCQRFNVSAEDGLDTNAAVKRLQRNGPNVLVQKRPQYWKKLARYVFGDFCSILWIGVIVFFISWKPLGNPPAPYNLALAIVVLLVIFLQASFSAFQDWSSQKTMDAILSLVPETAVVIRDGQVKSIPSNELVVGDVVQLSNGQKVPADMRIIKASNDLKFDKAVLTGEAEEIAGTVDSDEHNILEAKNIALLGTHVCNGSATAVVILTGARTVMGRINKITNNGTEERTNLQREITRFVKIIIAMTATLILAMLITWVAWLRVDHYDFINVVGILTNCMSLIVAFIPEGMPMAVALTLSLIARRMRDVHILPKSLTVVETLGCVNVVCSDKTGTLTENRMSIVSLAFVDQEFPPNDPPRSDKGDSSSFREFRKGMTLCNDAKFDEEHDSNTPAATRKVIGNATDGALLRYTEALPPSDIASTYSRVYDLPFNSKNKFAVTMTDSKVDGREIIIKGAPDILMERCAFYLASTGETVPLDATAKNTLIALQEKWSRLGQRVILIARCHAPDEIKVDSPDVEVDILQVTSYNLTVVGLIGILDPPRHDTKHTVSEIRRCGARVFMVTGDFSLTAASIARQCDIFRGAQDPDRIADFEVKNRAADYERVKDDRLTYIESSLLIEGKEIGAITEDQWNIICKYEEIVFARTTPEQKLRIVEELKARSATVAVTGDGVNDAPALKAANIGIAMVNGSEVAMEASDLVLMGNFSSIIEGLRLGRLVFENLQKAISYLLPAGSWSEDWPVLLNVFMGVPLPLSSFLMIIICCFTDLASCTTLIFEKEEYDLLSLPPRDPKHSHLINLPIYLQSYAFMGMMETVTAHAMFFYYIYVTAGIPVRSMFFVFAKFSDGYYGHTQDELNSFLNTGQCVYFVTLVILQIFNLMSVRNKRMSIFQRGPQHNWYLFAGPVVSLAIAIFVTECKGLQNLFGTASVPIKFWMLPIPLGVGLLMMDELRKLAVRTWPKSTFARWCW